MGLLAADRVRGKEIFAFAYDDDWLSSGAAQQLDPDLALFEGRHYLREGRANFGLFLDSSPDRWGRLLMRRREACYARREGRAERPLAELDCLLGVYDGQRMAAIRIGPDALENIERVSVSNCVIRDTRLNGIKIQESFGARIGDLVFSNIVMDRVVGPISLRLAGWRCENAWFSYVFERDFDDSNWEAGKLENVLFENIRARTTTDCDWLRKEAISITGAGKARPRGITFSNVDVTFMGGGTAEEGTRRGVPDCAHDYPELGMFGVLPAYGLYIHHADEIVLNNVRFRVESEDRRPAIVCDDVQDLELAGFKAQGHPESEALIRLENTRRAFVSGCRPLGEVKTFVRVEGAASAGIDLHGNFPAGAQEIDAKQM